MTVPNAVISSQGIFKEGMAYVALSCVTKAEGLFLRDFDEAKIYGPEKLADYMSQAEILNIPKHICPLFDVSTFTVVFHNIQSLSAHLQDLQRNVQMCKCDVIALTETWILESAPVPILHNFYSLAFKCYRSSVCFFVKDLLRITSIPLPETSIDVLPIKLYEPEVVVCVVYRKPSIPLNTLNSDIQQILPYLPDCYTVIGGHFNINVADNPQTVQPHSLQALGFTQIILSPTTIAGTLLDHIYITNFPTVNNSGVVQTYYSYPDAVF